MTNGPIAPTRIAGLLLGTSLALAGCAQGSNAAGEEPIAQTRQHIEAAWEWKDVPGTECNEGSQTGFAINAGTTDDILIYLEGGNFCWDAFSCGAGLASHVTTGYDGAKFASNPPRSGIFDRTNPANPYKDSTIVYVPYCTGDFHSGDAVNGALHFKGRVNLELDIAEVKSTFPNPSRVTLSGSSAGGFGAVFNYESIAQTFAGTRVDLVADSATILWANSTVFAHFGAWNAWTALPAGCATCRTFPRDIYSYYSTSYPNSRFAFVGFEQDTTLSLIGYVLLPILYQEELRKLVFRTLSGLPNWKHFVAPGMDHTTLYDIGVTTQNKRCNWVLGICFPTTYGPTTDLATFLTKMYTDDPTWAKQSSLIE